MGFRFEVGSTDSGTEKLRFNQCWNRRPTKKTFCNTDAQPKILVEPRSNRRPNRQFPVEPTLNRDATDGKPDLNRYDMRVENRLEKPQIHGKIYEIG